MISVLKLNSAIFLQECLLLISESAPMKSLKKSMNKSSLNSKSSLHLKNRYQRAALSLEAAFVVPIITSVFLLFSYIFSFMFIQMSIVKVVGNFNTDFATAAYTLRRYEKDKLDNVDIWVWGCIYPAMESVAKNKNVNHLWVSCKEKSKSEVTVKVSYEYELGIMPDKIKGVSVVQEFCVYPFVGIYDKSRLDSKSSSTNNKDSTNNKNNTNNKSNSSSDSKKQTEDDTIATSEEDMKEPVYVTENGSVYHKSKVCSYLTVLMTRIDYSTLNTARNSSGGKYKPCKSCAEGKIFSGNDVVYVSKSGTSFHSTPICKSLIKTVKAMEKEIAAKTRKPCSKCN